MLVAPAKKRMLIAIASLLLGLGMVLFISDSLFPGPSSDDGIPIDANTLKDTFYQGTITYISSSLYPEDEIGYSLTDDSGDLVILLKAKDQILLVSEGLRAKVYGTVSSTKDGKNKVLLVESVEINNVSN